MTDHRLVGYDFVNGTWRAELYAHGVLTWTCQHRHEHASDALKCALQHREAEDRTHG